MTPQVLDAIQLKMIQSTHRGFLYQHLFGVASLLISGETHLRELVPERDEDQELVFEAKRSYLQIKTRDRHLGVGDLEGVLERFARIRTEHSEGRRDGVPEFWIVSNVAPTQSLEDQVKQWPADVFFLSPDWVWGNPHNLPPAWRDLESAVTWCVEAASKVPFPSLAPPTMVWKLAGMIQAACAGANLSFEVAQLPTILEQLVIQLQKFPLTPVKYRPLDDEPVFDTEEPVRLVVGFSGSGKTTWAAHGSQHSGSAVVYFDVGDLPVSGIAAQLAREIAASVLGTRTDQIRKLILPGTGGLQILVGLDTILKDQSSKPIVVLDNAHRAAAVDLAAIFAALPNARWIVLAQPWPGAAELETRLGIAAHSLPGWSLLTIGAVFDEQAAAIDPQLAEEFRRLTGGLPLYVQSAARVAGTAYKGNAREFCRELKQLTHLKTTGQEEILKQVQQHLTPTAADVSAVLSLADVPLTEDEVLKVVERTLDLSSQEAGAAIRELQTWGIVDQLLDGDLVMHDAFRLLARQHGNGLGPDRLMKGREALVSILLRPREGIGHMRLLLTLLPTVGKTDVLIDVASGNSELLHELGMAVDVESMLEKARQQPDMSPEDRFWAVQTLLFWTIQNGEFAKAEADPFWSRDCRRSLSRGSPNYQTGPCA